MTTFILGAFSLKLSKCSVILFRNKRTVSKRGPVFKTLKDFKVKNVTEDSEEFIDYKEIAKKIKENDLDIEETFLKGEDFETVISDCHKIHDVHLREEKDSKRVIKKQIIGRKYFKDQKETNLLTYAAKEQIRYLHNLYPVDWTPEVLATSFPITVKGTKRLLKSNFVLTCPEKIKKHDEEVKKRWEILESGELSDSISFYTQCLWKDGKLLKENYNGKPDLPNTTTPPGKLVKTRKRIAPGEYSAIIQKYIEYKAKSESSQNKNSELTVRSEKASDRLQSSSNNLESNCEISDFKKTKIYKGRKNFSYEKGQQFDEVELPFSQFKENLKHELGSKKKTSVSGQYHQWIEQQDARELNIQKTKKAFNSDEFFPKIQKHNKEGIPMKKDESKAKQSFYVFDEQLGYQHPDGEIINGNICIPADLKRKNNSYRIGKCVYDEDGEFLYKLPK